MLREYKIFRNKKGINDGCLGEDETFFSLSAIIYHGEYCLTLFDYAFLLEYGDRLSIGRVKRTTLGRDLHLGHGETRKRGFLLSFNLLMILDSDFKYFFLEMEKERKSITFDLE